MCTKEQKFSFAKTLISENFLHVCACPDRAKFLHVSCGIYIKRYIVCIFSLLNRFIPSCDGISTLIIMKHVDLNTKFYIFCVYLEHSCFGVDAVNIISYFQVFPMLWGSWYSPFGFQNIFSHCQSWPSSHNRSVLLMMTVWCWNNLINQLAVLLRRMKQSCWRGPDPAANRSGFPSVGCSVAWQPRVLSVLVGLQPSAAGLGCRRQAEKRFSFESFQLHIVEMGNKCAGLENNHQNFWFLSLLSSAHPSRCPG